ncbi:di-heme-cytochrome C peroxidase [Simiduia sp. 21SJ11W-1]|uniref:di-heme-cytochrome C peroxidase n=1 Tax=Simiduia sp. 21SJ11W-1 TaxID=2909669 RepID=UPI00209E3521|nr:di-heme-cytochrome C peroxidase [Simiduia sp. 21SJ11W-1]UTA48165.1 di-heme-cytochrome C peroxidase [Simiduia sp. 21SJ11W-1]
MTGISWGRLGLYAAIAATCLTACDHSPAERHAHTPSGLLLLDQNWDDATRNKAWFTSFGSRVMPESWFLALEQPGRNTPFNNPQYLEAFGFAVPGASEANPNNLAIGLTVTPEREGHQWLGLGCSACHSGQVFYKNTRIHIDGGAALLDFQAFEQAAIEALEETLSTPEKFARFASRLQAAEPEALRTEVGNWASTLRARQHTNRTQSHYGYGRLDAFGQIFNAVAADFLNIPENRRDPNAPVSYPVLWDASHLDLVQWNASAPNAGPGPLIQNATTALAVFGHLNVSAEHSGLGYPSTIEMENLGPIQDQWYQLSAPQWPENVLGKIDKTLAAQGESIYARECLQCHTLSDRNNPKRILKSTAVDIAAVGTDPTMAQNFTSATAKTGAFEGKKVLFAAGDVIGETAPTIELVAHAAVGALLHHPLAATWQAALSNHKVEKAPLYHAPHYYKARPLSGIWSSAPYLHNGSVPTLHAMLSGPAARPAQFPVGKVEFDPIKVGLSTNMLDENQAHTFDTTLPANSNAGHLYGTALTEAEKHALLEYLKTL